MRTRSQTGPNLNSDEWWDSLLDGPPVVPIEEAPSGKPPSQPTREVRNSDSGTRSAKNAFKQSGSSPPAQDEQDLIDAGITTLFESGQVVELRIPNAGGKGTVSGYFDDFNKLKAEIGKCNGKAEGIYYTLNPVNPALLARSCNHTKERAKNTTADRDILKRVWLLIDVDPQRPAGVSSTNDEKELAGDRTRAIREWLRVRGWPEPLVADSGNGYHLLYRIDLPNDKINATLVKDCLSALAGRFDDEVVKVDTSVYNPARIIKAYGTLAAKGDNTQDRPHRTARLRRTENAGGKETVPKELLEALASEAPTPKALQSPEAETKAVSTTITPGKMDEFLVFYEIKHKERTVFDGGLKWVLDSCLFNPEHKDAAVLLRDGVISYHCFHSSCQRHGWREFREELERRTGKTFRFVAKAGFSRQGQSQNRESPLWTFSEQEAGLFSISEGSLSGHVWDANAFRGHTVPPVEPLVGDILHKQEVVALVARRRSGKTSLLTGLAVAGYLGDRHWLEFDIPGPFSTLYVYLEDRAENIQKKLDCLIGRKTPAEHGGFTLITKSDLKQVGWSIGTTPTHFMAFLRKAVESLRPDLLVIDNTRIVLEGEFNKPDRVHALMSYCDELAEGFGCAIILPSHPRKYEQGNVGHRLKLADDSEAFFEEVLGSSIFLNAASNLWGMERDYKTALTTVVLGAQRTTGDEVLMTLNYRERDQSFEVVRGEENLQMLLTSDKKRGAWNKLPSSFTWKEGQHVTGMADSSLSRFLKHGQRLGVLEKDLNGVYHKQVGSCGWTLEGAGSAANGAGISHIELPAGLEGAWKGEDLEARSRSTLPSASSVLPIEVEV